MALNVADRRARPRFALSVPVALDGATGHTRDISADAVCFDVEGHVAAEGRLRFTMFFLDQNEGPPHRLHCEGAIIRASPRATGLQLVVRLDSCDVEVLRRPRIAAARG